MCQSSDHLYFVRVIGQSRSIILCYEGRLDTIFLDGSQFIRSNLSVLSLCLKERPK